MNSQTTSMMTNAQTLFGAAEAGDAAEVARLLASGASADERRAPGGETPLMRAAAGGHEDVARALLDAGADACARRADGFTPLILAVFFGHEGVVRLLLERGVDASARTSLGATAAQWAEARGLASMAEVLRGAEASRPGVAVAHVFEEAARAKAATATASDEVEIFSKGRGRKDAGREEEADKSPAPARGAEEEVYSSNVTAAGDPVRRGAQLPAHPPASPFTLGHFLRSWQGSLGVLLLLTAFGVAVFALVGGGKAPRGEAQPAPTTSPAAPQAAAQQTPAPLPPTPAPSPAFPTPDAQGIMPVPDQTYVVPKGAGQPSHVSTGLAAPVVSDAPRELTVVSESGAPSARDAGQSGRRAGASDSSTPARGDASNVNASDAAPRATPTPEPEPQRPAAVPAPSPDQPPPPAPRPTPRAKIIPWPPQ